jgi:hypothetical protein
VKQTTIAFQARTDETSAVHKKPESAIMSTLKEESNAIDKLARISLTQVAE